MKTLNIRISFLAAVVLFCGCNSEEPEMSSKRYSKQHTIQAYFDLSGTRAFLEEQKNSYDLLAKWLANDHIRVFYNIGEKYVGTDPIVVAEVTPDGVGAKFQYTVPSTWGKHDTYDVKIFTDSCFPAAKDDKLYFNASIIRQPLELFQVPVYSEGEVNEYGVLNATFHHYYTYELLHISNTSNSDIEFSLLGFEGTLWYKEKGSICIDNGAFVIDAPSTRDPKRESTPITIKPGETRTIVSAYIPNGTIYQATMVTKINGEYVHSSNTKTSGIELKQGHAYHMYAGWDGEKLEFWNNAEEPLNVETLSAEVNPQTLFGTFTGTVTNSSIEGLKTGFRFWKENMPEDYVEYDSTSSSDDSFNLNLFYGDFIHIANEGAVEGKYYVSAFVVDANGTRYHGNTLEFTLENGQPSSAVIPEIVDLGLSVKWASFNLGATKPEEYGYYYAWGEIIPKQSFSWGTYKWCNGSDRTLTKYNTDRSYGIVDNKITLDPEDDAAFMNLGDKWRMPTKAEQDELIQNCVIESKKVNGVQGRLFTSRKNGNSIFIPANGYYHSPGTSGEYWSSSLWVGRPFDAYDLDFTQSLHLENGGRYESRGIRPIYDDGTRTSIITSTPTNVSCCSVEIPFTISTSGTIRGIGIVYSTNNSDPETRDYGDGSYIVYSTSDICSSMIVNYLKPNTTYYARPFVALSDGTELYGNTIQFTTKGLSYSTEYVDLGLSVRWATCNLGASSPHEVGAYYNWGETEPAYMMPSYKWGRLGEFTKYNAEDGKVTLEASDDAASVNLGGNWRMPTNEEYDELRNSCTWAPATRSGVPGCTVTGKNGNSIFIPVSEGFSDYFRAIALSSTLNTYYEGYQYVHALSYNYNNNIAGSLSTFRDGRNPIRPVFDDSYIPVESITLDKSELELAVGESAGLVVSISPSNATNQTISWTSSNEAVASVSNTGTVTGLSAGTAVITATTVDGGKTAQCNVTIKRTGINIVDQGNVIIYTINGVELRMVKVEGGTFRMGSHHDVTLSTYYISDRPVSKRLYSAIVNGVDSGDDGVFLSTWAGKSADILKLNELTGSNFHLASEAQFEFAAKGGIYSHGYTYAGTNDSSLLTSKFPNELNLYMMSSGPEWVYDYCCAYPDSAVVDPVESVWKKNWPSGDWKNGTLMRVERGRSAVESRYFSQPYHPNNQYAHRLVFETTNDAAWKNGDYVGDYK